MAGSDGSIVFSTELDNKKAQQELNSLSKKIDNLNRKIYQKQQEKLPLVEQSERLSAELDAAKAKLESMKSGTEFFTAKSIQDQSVRVKELQKEFDSVDGKIQKIDVSIKRDTASVNEMKERAGELSAQLAGTGESTDYMAAAVDRAGKHLDKFTSRIKGLARRVFVFTMITAALRSMRTWFGNVIKTNSEATAAVAKLKGALLTLAQPLVNVIIPAFTAFVNVLTKIVAAIADVVSMIFGTTIEQSADAAENLYDEQQALNSVGTAAKKAGKSLASFDEINKLTGDSSYGGASVESSTIKPDFASIKDNFLSSLTFTLSDILFEWDNLTAEDILAKIISGLSAITGGIIGFVLGGPGGAALGIMIGAGIGIAISNLIFNGDGVLSSDEILESLLLALGALVGGIIGFTLGGPGGAAIGVAIGAGISLFVMKLIFNGDGVLSQEEILSSAVVALGAIAGGIIGFALGGPGGAAIGVMIGTGITLSIIKIFFNGDGAISTDEVMAGIAVALGAIAGGVIGFSVGGPGGAAIGALIGTGITAKIVEIAFDGNSKISVEKVIGGLVEFLIAFAGGAIGFIVGGPGGAVIGAAVGVALSLIVDKAMFSDSKTGYEEGKKVGDNATKGAEDALGINSPSTEFRQIGDYMMQGMENGITENSNAVSSAFQLVLDALQTEFDTWNINFMSGFTQFEETFSDRWKTMWSNVNIQFVKSWNNILDTFQNGINSAIDALNELVREANALAGLTGTRYKYAGRISVQKLTIPKLAQGAVIPPNKEFLAVLGDQKQGTNIETPLATMVQAFKQALAETGYGGSSEAVLMLDRDVLGKVVYRLNKSESNRIGVNLTEV